MSQDCVALHCQTIKELPWASLADGWPAADELPDSLPSLEALHEAYVKRFDMFRDSERGARLLHAIQVVAERARAGTPVSWEGLCSLQSLVLERESVGFRNEPAYANARMETYGFHPRLEAVFAKKLTRDDAEELHPLLKACRLYLDIRLFYPFEDGNGAGARLAFQWVAQRAGVRLAKLTPLFRLRIRPGNSEDYQALFDLAASLLRSS